MIDLYTRCYGCQRDFQPGDLRLRFSLNEWERYEGRPETPDIGIEIGLCDDCTQAGDFKDPEVVPASPAPGNRATICPLCGSGLLDGLHLRGDLPPCYGDPIPASPASAGRQEENA